MISCLPEIGTGISSFCEVSLRRAYAIPSAQIWPTGNLRTVWVLLHVVLAAWRSFGHLFGMLQVPCSSMFLGCLKHVKALRRMRGNQGPTMPPLHPAPAFGTSEVVKWSASMAKAPCLPVRILEVRWSRRPKIPGDRTRRSTSWMPGQLPWQLSRAAMGCYCIGLKNGVSWSFMILPKYNFWSQFKKEKHEECWLTSGFRIFRKT